MNEFEELVNFLAKCQKSAQSRCIGNVFIGIVERPWGKMVRLEYGDKEDEFNPDGYTLLYNMKCVLNSDVMAAILE